MNNRQKDRRMKRNRRRTKIV